MASSFKTLLSSDVQSISTNLHEAVPITGSILSGTYSNDSNIKNYPHGMFQSVFDYPYLSSSANHILDVTLGMASSSAISGAAATYPTQWDQKLQIYNQMAQMLAGYTPSNDIRAFNMSGNYSLANTIADMREVYFIDFSRLLAKDEVKKGSFTMELGLDALQFSGGVPTPAVTVADTSGNNSYKVNSPAGEFNLLHASASLNILKSAASGAIEGVPCGLIFYQAGVLVLTSSLFKVASSGGLLSDGLVEGSGTAGQIQMSASGLSTPNLGIDNVFGTSSISAACDAIRERVHSLSFNNTTELNSTVYFCRANSNEFNYSSNPTYLSASKMKVKNERSDEPISYLTTVGLYGANNELLAVAKLSEPLKKTPADEFTLRVRLDY